MDILSVVFVVGGSAFMLSSRPLRTRRTAAFLLAFGATVLGARSILPPWWAFAAQVIAVVSYVVVLFWFQHLLGGSSRHGAAFDRQLHASIVDAERAVSEWREAARRGDATAIESSRSGLVDRSRVVLAALVDLAPPDDRWREVVALERQYFEAMCTYAGRQPQVETAVDPGFDAIVEIGQRLEKAWARARRET